MTGPGKKGDGLLPLVEGRDYEWDEGGLMVFTAAYHRRRGYCCKSGCRHCPYGFQKSPQPNRQPPKP